MNCQLKYLFWQLLGNFLARKCERTFSVSPDRRKLTSVLTLRPDRLGDVLLSTPVYESIKSSLPQTKLTVIAQAGPAKALENNPHVDRILIFNPKAPWEIFRELRSEKFDIAIVLNQVFSATATTLALLSGSSWRIGYAHPQNVGAFNIRVPLPETVKPEIEHNLDVLRHMNFPHISKTPTVYPNEATINRIDRLLISLRSRSDLPMILIKPGTRMKKWGWQIDKFKALYSKIREYDFGEPLLIQGPKEEGLIVDFQNGMTPPPKVLPLLDIQELACVMKKADLLICNHTGIMHLASAVKTSVVAIFKHGNTLRWGPFGVPHIILEERNNDCLSPDTVFKESQKLLFSQTQNTSSSLRFSQ